VVTMNTGMLQGQTEGNKKKAKSPLSRVPKCPLCDDQMLEGQKTSLVQLKMNGYTTVRRVHSLCGGIDG
jgi:hypothetical protein